MAEKPKYSLVKGLQKTLALVAILYGVSVGNGIAVDKVVQLVPPEIGQMTIVAAIYWLRNYLKTTFGWKWLL